MPGNHCENAPDVGTSHLSPREGDHGFFDFLAVRRFNLIGPAIFAEVITVTGVIAVVRSEDVCPILLW